MLTRSLRAVVAATAALLAIAAIPAGASAAKGGCLYSQDAARESNRIFLERSLLCLTNVHRLKNGVGPLFRDSRLSAAARAHSTDMANRHYFSHDSPEGVTASQRAVAAGYPAVSISENIATSGAATALSLFEQWRNSTAGHNENMLRGDWAAAGMGVDPRFATTGDPGITGTQMFGSAPADTEDDALDLYASTNKCARAKLAVINGKRRLKKKKGEAARILRRQLKNTRKLIAKICDAPPGAKD